jgi:hypothetical protein
MSKFSQYESIDGKVTRKVGRLAGQRRVMGRGCILILRIKAL